jgi:hypothetical protein
MSLSRRKGGFGCRTPGHIQALMAILRRYRVSAKARGIEFALGQTEFINLTGMPCFYCGIPPIIRSLQVHSRRVIGEPRAYAIVSYNGIDRLDNSKGYMESNCVSCCKVCNRAKDIMTVKEFYEWVERVHSFKV